jgi:hypothetical protein
MHAVFARDVRYDGVDDWDDFNRRWLLEYRGTCPQCQGTICASTQCLGSGCDCEDVTWRLNQTVVTDDLPPYPWSISQVRTRALQIITESAGKRKGKIACALLAKLVKEFGRKAVDDAIQSKVPAAKEQLLALAPPQVLHSGQRSVTAPNPRRASFYDFNYECNRVLAGFSYHCPECHNRFTITTKELVAKCKCQSVTWRLNIAIATHNIPPHSWHPETIRKSAIQSLLFQRDWNRCEESGKLWEKVVSEFGKAAHNSIMEV